LEIQLVNEQVFIFHFELLPLIILTNDLSQVFTCFF